MAVDDLQTLIDQRDIQYSLHRLARAMDERDWVSVAAGLADEVIADLGTGLLNGSEPTIAVMRRFLDACGTTQHLLGNVCVEVSGDNAVSRAYVHDTHLSKDGTERFYTLGEYRDTWKRRDGRWLIVERFKVNRASVGSLEAVFGGSTA
jgi:hypothetical protein